MQLDGRTILITGAGSGIGRALGVALARAGGNLVLVGRRADPLDETAELARAHGAAVVTLAGDVNDERTRARAVELAETRFGSLAVLVNNAGNVAAGRLEDLSGEDIRAQVELNLVAPILLTQAALPALRRSDAAAVVLISSAIALVGVPFYGPYAATKAGVAHFGEALRRELHGDGVHVMTVYPGATSTPMMDSSDAGPDLGFQREPAEAVAEATVEGLVAGELTVVRGGKVRRDMIAANRDDPRSVDERFAGMRPDLLAAVARHRSI